MLDLHEIKDYFGNTIFNRGLSYHREQRVTNLKYETDEDGDIYIHATVKGSGHTSYRCAAEVSDGIIVETFCGCPYPGECKHAVALLLAFLEAQPAATQQELHPVDPADLPPDREIPVQRRPGPSLVIADRFSRVETDDPLANYRPVFILKHSKYNDPSLQIMRQFIKKDGSYGALSPFIMRRAYRINAPETGQLVHIFFQRDETTIPLFQISGPFLNAIRELPLFNEEKEPLQILPFRDCTFSMRGFDLDDENNFTFTPAILTPPDENGLRLIFEPEGMIALPEAVLFYSRSRNTLLICREPMETVRFLETAMDETERYSAWEAEKVLQIAAERTLGLTVEPLMQRVKICTRLPQPAIYLYTLHGKTILIPLFYYGPTPVQYGSVIERILLERNETEVLLAERVFDQEKYLLQQFYTLCDRLFPAAPTEGNLPALTLFPGSIIAEHGRDFLEAGFHILLDPATGKKITATANAKLRITTGIDWFDLSVTAEGQEEPVQLNSRLLQQGVVEHKGEITLLDRSTLQQLQRIKTEAKIVDGKLRIDRWQLSLIEELYSQATERDRNFETAAQLGRKLLGMEPSPQIRLPRSFHGELRPYQQRGVEWMKLLLDNGLGALLADDMGLGKTVQTIALIQTLRAEKMQGPVLIIVPVSTLFNWEAEFALFAPAVLCTVHRGSDRENEAETLTARDVILTSYHTLRNDIKLFSSISFPLIILDEAQAIKNSSSLIFKAVKSLHAERRLTLTGTPVENNTMELWSQLNFLNPGLLGSKEHFRKSFAKPIEKDSDPVAAERLNKITAPFILRRRKESVALELPDKEEVILYTEMGSRQRKAYDSLRNEYRLKLTAAAGKKSPGKQEQLKFFSIVLEGMLRLRQICLMPELAGSGYEGIESCKVERLYELLPEISAEGHKILLFSQFTGVLNNLKKQLPYSSRQICTLDGSTRDRKKPVEQFQNDPGKKIFLISLKAGGTGLNLTAAEYVFIFDPWWNPAVEAQAIDRAHRIGQNQKVFAYKLIVKDSIEEKILQLQQKKKELADALISEEQGALKKLSEAEILKLFS